MKKIWGHLSPYRVRTGQLRSTDDCGGTGCFVVPGPHHRTLRIVSSDGTDGSNWEHVSASCPKGTPSWAEMTFVKRLFWEDEECVMQLHPPQSQYVNMHPYVLHLWRPLQAEIPQPPGIMVGLPGIELDPNNPPDEATRQRIERSAYVKAVAEGWLA